MQWRAREIFFICLPSQSSFQFYRLLILDCFFPVSLAHMCYFFINKLPLLLTRLIYLLFFVFQWMGISHCAIAATILQVISWALSHFIHGHGAFGSTPRPASFQAVPDSMCGTGGSIQMRHYQGFFCFVFPKVLLKFGIAKFDHKRH